jgi:hypothetical protein
MIESLKQKIVVVTPPAAIVDNAAVTTASIDTKGWDWCDIYVVVGATDIAVAVLKLREADDDSTYSDVTNGNFATGTLPSGSSASLPSATDDNHVFAFRKDCRKGKRYLDVSLTGGDGAAGAFFAVFALLSRGKEAPNTSAERGVTQELFC